MPAARIFASRVFALLLSLGCREQETASTPAPLPEASPTSLVFVGIDGLDPRLLRGLLRDDPQSLPHLQRLVKEGFMVDLAVSTTPMLSPILWTTLSSGYESSQHGVQAWLLADGRVAGQGDLGVRRFWEAASKEGQQVLQIGSLLTSPASRLNGVNIGERFVREDLKGEDHDLSAHVQPSSLEAELRSLIPSDEWLSSHAILGEQMAYNSPRVHPARKDEASVRYFERLWPELQPDLAVVYLEGVDRVGHLADPRSGVGSQTGAGQQFSSFSEHGPDWVKAYYLYIDSCLGRVIQQLDPSQTTLVIASDHGWEVLGDDPEWESRHRDPGLLIGWGARVRTEVDYTAVSQVDLGVSLYALTGLAAGADAPVQPLDALFILDGAPEASGSWLIQPSGKTLDGSTSNDAVEELRALGYVDSEGRSRPDTRRQEP